MSVLSKAVEGTRERVFTACVVVLHALRLDRLARLSVAAGRAVMPRFLWFPGTSKAITSEDDDSSYARLPFSLVYNDHDGVETYEAVSVLPALSHETIDEDGVETFDAVPSIPHPFKQQGGRQSAFLQAATTAALPLSAMTIGADGEETFEAAYPISSPRNDRQDEGPSHGLVIASTSPSKVCLGELVEGESAWATSSRDLLAEENASGDVHAHGVGPPSEETSNGLAQAMNSQLPESPGREKNEGHKLPHTDNMEDLLQESHRNQSSRESTVLAHDTMDTANSTGALETQPRGTTESPPSNESFGSWDWEGSGREKRASVLTDETDDVDTDRQSEDKSDSEGPSVGLRAKLLALAGTSCLPVQRYPPRAESEVSDTDDQSVVSTSGDEAWNSEEEQGVAGAPPFMRQRVSSLVHHSV